MKIQSLETYVDKLEKLNKKMKDENEGLREVNLRH